MTQTKNTPLHSDMVKKQFGSQAKAYVSSQVHSDGEDLSSLAKLLKEQTFTKLLDLGCGGGHVSYTAAPLVKEIIAYDMNDAMLHCVSETASQRGFHNIHTQQGIAESLPFEDDAFDIVASRYSSHHWHDVPKALYEACRVLSSKGSLIIMDVVSAGHPLSDTHLQTVEMLRDPSHVRDYSIGEWVSFINQAEFQIHKINTFRLYLDYASWIARMNTPAVLSDAIRALQQTAPIEVKQYFDIQPDGSFWVDCMILTAQKMA